MPQRLSERAIFWRDAQLAGLDLLHARFVTHSFLPHQHETYALGVIQAGVETFRYRGARHVAPAGSVIVVHPGEAHTGHAAIEGGWRYRMLYPDPGWLNVACGRADTPFFPSPVICDDELAQLLNAAHAAFEGTASALERESRLLAALTHLTHRHAKRAAPSPAAPGRAALVRIRDFLDASPGANVTLSDLAAQVQLSPFYFARQFRAAFGVPPHTYQLTARVRAARTLMLAGASLARAALEVGFADQAHLTRSFKRVYGVPPGRYLAGLSKAVQDLRLSPA